MARYDAVIIGAGLGGLTAGAILARAGRKVLLIERGNSVGGAASSYKVGELFVEGSLHETSDPRDPRDPKHRPLTRAGVLDAVTWVPARQFYTVRGGPVGAPLALPDNFSAARHTLAERFPRARSAIAKLLGEMETFTHDPSAVDWSLSLSQKLEQMCDGDEALKAAVAANLSYYHDNPETLSWAAFAMAQGSYLLNGGVYVQGGSQRLSSALARAIRAAGGDISLRRAASAISLDTGGVVSALVHTAKDGSDPQTVETSCVIGNAAPENIASLLPGARRAQLRATYADRQPSISLFALTLGLSKPPSEFGIDSYSTQLLPDWMTRFADYSKGTALMADEPGERMPPLAIVDYAAIDSGVPAPPYVLSVIGPDALTNWDGLSQDEYRAKRGRWQNAIIAYLERYYAGLSDAIVASSFNTALSVRQYLAAPHGSVYGFAPTPSRTGDAPRQMNATPITGLYLASAYAGLGGYTGVIQSAELCADLVLKTL
ncbi:phytoene desaturase family protein [Bradyrhizobium sp. SYSU BS000235]|uniref:phytoene desaturase family protein n=1 Tax=Bradyrhizobium sp. SYSU BS000235 TaxID=3411332 RepID=UPI003C7791E8